MKAKKTAPPRRRVSFAVDRDEIEINSDWVEAVMTSPAPPVVSREPIPAPIPFPAPQPVEAPPAVEAERPLFFASDENIATDTQTATGAEIAPGAECTAVEKTAAVDQVAPVADSMAVEDGSSVENTATVVKLAAAEGETIGRNPPVLAPTRTGPVDNIATVEHITSVAGISTAELSSSTRDHRRPRPRPIVRITDGLTPGQYAVYSLMYEAGEGIDAAARIYKGGYADLGRLTGLSKRGIQNIVAELQAKQVIRIHQQPGYHRTETSAYRVPNPEAVLQAWFARGWKHALGKSKLLTA